MALITVGRFSRPAAWTRMVIPIGMSMPPPTPCSARKAMSSAGGGGQPAQGRAHREQDERDHVDPVGAEAAHGPGRERDDGAEGQEVGRDHPLDVAERAVEIPRQLARATLTIVVSSTVMIEPSTTTIAIRRTWGSRSRNEVFPRVPLEGGSIMSAIPDVGECLGTKLDVRSLGVKLFLRGRSPGQPQWKHEPCDPRIRPVEPADVPAVVGLVHQLADYERAADACHLSDRQLQAALFGDRPALFGHVAVVEGEVVGFALWFLNFSTWRGVHGIYLEDLFVLPAHRGTGLGRALLGRLAQECVARGYARLEWAVLDWNEPSIGFYRSLGAVSQDEWSVFRLDDASLEALARS